MSAELDLTEFNAALRDYMAKCPHTLEEILNKKMTFILRSAWQRTPEAQRTTIEHDLAVAAYKISRSRKTGKVKRGKAILQEASRVYALINARRHKAGQRGLYGKDMARAAARLVAARLRAAGTLKRGWLRNLIMFGNATRESVPSGATGGRLPAGRGDGKVAQPGWNPIAEASYDANIENKKDAHIDPRVEQALADAFATEAASMREYVEKKIQEDLDKMQG